MNAEQQAALRKEFPPECIGKLPKAGITLDYVGHALTTDRLLSVDPEWTWEPMALDADGGPLIRRGAKELTMWIRLSVCGVTRLGVGSVQPGAFDPEKQLIGDALRNAAMRFGVALDLWSKAELESAHLDDSTPSKPRRAKAVEAPPAAPTTTRRPPPSNGGGPVCAGCGNPFGEEPVRRANGRNFHAACSPSAGAPGEGAGEVAPPSESLSTGAASPTDGPSTKQLGMMAAILGKLGVPDSDRHRYVSDLLGLPEPVTSMKQLTKRQTSQAIDALQAEQVGV